MAKKVNPRRIPKTQADVDAAWKQGVMDGINNAIALFMTVICDKYNGQEYIKDIWAEVNKLSESVNEGRLTFADMRTVLREEYDILV